MATLTSYLQSGRLGLLSSGSPPAELTILLGEPDGIMDKKHSLLWKYGPLQLGFHRPSRQCTPILESIRLYFHNQKEKLPSGLKFEGWWPDSNTSCKEFRDHLCAERIEVLDESVSGPTVQLRLCSGVHATFEDGLLYSICYTDERFAGRQNAENKQVTISIAPQDLAAIQREATATNTSVSKVCSRWVADRVATRQST